MVEEVRLGWIPLAAPGCLKRPKLIDFLCGCMLQEIVCPAETFTQRTRYDCCLELATNGAEHGETCLAVDLELLHARHDLGQQRGRLEKKSGSRRLKLWFVVGRGECDAAAELNNE